jgi:hypothetical protein
LRKASRNLRQRYEWLGRDKHRSGEKQAGNLTRRYICIRLQTSCRRMRST